jgi:Integrase core domain
MKRMEMEALYRHPRTTKPESGHKIYPYLLRGMEIVRPNQVWAMDITYVPMARGFVYLAVVLDWFSRRVLSRRVSITTSGGGRRAIRAAISPSTLATACNASFQRRSNSPATSRFCRVDGVVLSARVRGLVARLPQRQLELALGRSRRARLRLDRFKRCLDAERL